MITIYNSNSYLVQFKLFPVIISKEMRSDYFKMVLRITHQIYC